MGSWLQFASGSVLVMPQDASSWLEETGVGEDGLAGVLEGPHALLAVACDAVGWANRARAHRLLLIPV